MLVRAFIFVQTYIFINFGIVYSFVRSIGRFCAVDRGACVERGARANAVERGARANAVLALLTLAAAVLASGSAIAGLRCWQAASRLRCCCRSRDCGMVSEYAGTAFGPCHVG